MRQGQNLVCQMASPYGMLNSIAVEMWTAQPVVIVRFGAILRSATGAGGTLHLRQGTYPLSTGLKNTLLSLTVPDPSDPPSYASGSVIVRSARLSDTPSWGDPKNAIRVDPGATLFVEGSDWGVGADGLLFLEYTPRPFDPSGYSENGNDIIDLTPGTS